MNELTPLMGSLFGEMNLVEAKSESVIALLSTMTDEQVKMTYCYAQEVGKAAWRVECAANAEILKRVQARAWQRNGDGVVATLASVAYDLGVSPQTLYRDAQIHKTFFENKNILGAENVLQDKWFYAEALRASDPLAAIEAIAVKKADNPFYSTRDAKWDITRDLPPSAEIPPLVFESRTINLPSGVTEKDAHIVLSALASVSIEAGPGRIEKAVKVLAGETTNIHVSDDSYEWYTPAEYLQAARSVMGSIDLDPASSHHAQEMVQAGAFFSRADDGLVQEWRGTVWLNPPYSSPEVDNFMDKLVQEYQSGHVSKAIALTNNSTDTRWFHRAASASSAMCFTKGRIGFWKPEAAPLAARQGQVFFYMGDSPEQFAHLFAPFGLVVLPYPAA